MRFRWLSKLALIAAFLVCSTAARADVLKIVVNDTIQPVAAEYIERAVKEAQRSHADALLIQMNTPGGLVESMQEIVQKILSSPVPVIIYVAPSGSRAASAGFFILESADVAAMAPGTNTGAAHPVLGSPLSDRTVPMDPVMKDKLENDAAALMRSFVVKRGRNLELAESAIRQSKSFSADEALAQHLVEYIAKDEADLLRQIDGKTITRIDGAKTALHVAGQPVRLYEMSLREHILSRLLNPNLAALLISLGMLALWVEFSHPGAVVPGVVGFIAILVAVFAMHLLPVRYESLALILGAFVLFALEAKFHTHGGLTAGGIVMMIVGMMLLVNGPIPELRVQLWTALSVSIPLGLITAFLMTIAMRARRKKLVNGEPGLVGEAGVVTARLAPAGKVLLRGALWDATSSVTVELGQAVVVRDVNNLVLQVDPVPQAASLDSVRA